MKPLLFILVLALAATGSAADLLVLTGASGNDAYGKTFTEAAARWEKAAIAGGLKTVQLGAEETAREAFRAALQAHAEGPDELWVVLIGHGTFDGREARFNTKGDDFSGTELAAWLQPVKRPLIVICAFSCSGAFLKPLAAPGRVILTATRAGSEENYARLGEYLSETITDAQADLDGDGQTSLLEAWLAASRKVESFYKTDNRLSTEHSLLEDNGDSQGTPPDWFKNLKVVKHTKTNTPADGLKAHQVHLIKSEQEKALTPETRAKRDALEQDLALLKQKKPTLPPEEYAKTLEALLLNLARLYNPGP